MASHKNKARYQELQKKLKKRAALPPRVAQGAAEVVRSAQRLIDDNDLDEAGKQLEAYNRSHPGHRQVLVLLADVYQRQQAYAPFCRVCEQLMQQSPDDPAPHLMLASGYMFCSRPIAAWLAFQRYRTRWPDDPMIGSVEQTIRQIEPAVAQILAAAPFPEKEKLELAAIHEEMLACLEWGEYPQLVHLGRKLLRRYPGFVPAMNNLCIGYTQTGKISEALDLARQVVAQEPNNVHALGNLARGLLVSGHAEEAQDVLARLRTVPNDQEEVCTKKAETFSFFGDDQGVLEAFEAAQKAGYTSSKNPNIALLFHFAAVARARLGDWSQARKDWQQALRIEPELDRAQENLMDSKKPVAEREGPWAHDLQAWIPAATIERLDHLFAIRSKKDQDATIGRRFHEEHSEVARLVPHLLDRGDPAGRKFAIHYAELLDTSAMHAALTDFCKSQRGSDEQRRTAAMWLSQKGLLPERRMRLWMDGEWRELELMGFEVTSEPSGPKHSPEVEALASEALQALRDGNGKQAEELLQKCLAIEPDKPDLLNNLAAAYQLQSRDEEQRALVREIHQRWPDYFFACIALANLALDEGNYDQAEALIEPLQKQSRLHTTEFEALAQTYIRLFAMQGKTDAARSWLEMFKKCEPDHPAIPALEKAVDADEVRQTLGRLLRFR